MSKSVALTVCVFAALTLTTASAMAKPGFTGFAGVGGQTCGNCHSGGSVPTVSFKAAPASLGRGQTGTYTFGVTGSLSRTEIDVVALDKNGASVPLAGDGTTTKASGNDVVPVGGFFSGPSKDYTFSMTVPAGAATPITIYAVGMASNGGGTGGDGVAKTTFAVALTNATADAGMPEGTGDGGAAGPEDGGTGSSSGGSSSGAASSGGAPTGAGAGSGPPPTFGDDESAGGCATGRGGGRLTVAPMGALLAIAAVLRRLTKRCSAA